MPFGVHVSQRNTPALFGAKLIDEISERDIIANERKERLNYGLAPSDNETAPVGRAHRDLHNRRKQLNYRDAIEKKLPIGSDEIESAHRYIVQQRLKRPGAWWTPDNIDCLLALRLARANRRWADYWRQFEGEKLDA